MGLGAWLELRRKRKQSEFMRLLETHERMVAEITATARAVAEAARELAKAHAEYFRSTAALYSSTAQATPQNWDNDPVSQAVRDIKDGKIPIESVDPGWIETYAPDLMDQIPH